MTPPQAPPAVAAARTSADPTGSFAAIAAVGAAFAGYVVHGRSHDLATTAFAGAIAFFGALVALYVLHVVYHLALAAVKVAVPVTLVLLLGCALDWHWAETVVHWLRSAGSHGLQAASHVLRASQGG